MIVSTYHDSVNALQPLAAREGTCAPSPFDRAEWYALLAETGLTPLVAIASDGEDGAALALTRENGRIAPLRNWYSFTWRQLAPPGERGDRLLVEIARQLKSKGHRVTLAPVPQEDGSAGRLARAFRAAGWRVEVTRCDVNHVLHVRGRSFAQYWAGRPGRIRNTLKRKGRKVETRILCHFDAEAWSHYERIYAASWKPREDHPAMLRDFARAEGAAGRLRFGMAWHQGTPVAAQCWTVEGGTAFIHKLAHLESHRHLSAGTTLTAALFEHVIDRDGVAVVDFGSGDQPYKADWMEEIRPRYQIDCLDMGHVRGWIDLARLAARRLAAPDVPELAPAPPAG
ncbi:GNAT family N-acetyltransferase [Erythrobacter sp. HL-111]|uniref:GNAT family N-acetyltransferase n=1 Tax=Erythrobacter sp. HL-111 TaxID=1798193 RepID=UPI0006D971AB|nr:GNAT family N-acetyltransferase [Erythrobacter sp. HL-111]KPP96577.1 MAG: Acetyltransferase (GNAT) domain [Erythrobacteraceae bacterium HL-111]SDS03348.1 Acetyltransferase (GNAT) domain-containing protein [Erythrobacter sp. HL-111]